MRGGRHGQGSPGYRTRSVEHRSGAPSVNAGVLGSAHVVQGTEDLWISYVGVPPVLREKRGKRECDPPDLASVGQATYLVPAHSPAACVDISALASTDA